MTDKKLFELEFLLKTTPKILDKMLFTANGLAEWFSDDVHVNEDIYEFEWDGYIEEARLLSSKNGQYIKWQWIEDEEEELDTFFGFKYHVDPLTKSVILTVTGSSTDDELEESKALWEKQINNLKRLIGA